MRVRRLSRQGGWACTALTGRLTEIQGEIHAAQTRRMATMKPKLFTALPQANRYALQHLARGCRVAIERGVKGRQQIYIVHAWRDP